MFFSKPLGLMFNSFPALMPFTYTLLIGTPVRLPDVCVHHAKVFPIRLYDLYTHQCHMEQTSNKVFQTCLHNVGTNSGKQHSKAKVGCTVQAPKRALVHISLCFLRVWFTKLCRWLFVPYIWPVHTFPGESDSQKILVNRAPDTLQHWMHVDVSSSFPAVM